MAKSVKQLLEKYLKNTNHSQTLKTINIQRLWEKTVGAPIYKNTEIKSFNNGIITINVSNSTWRNELSMQKQTLIKKLNKTQSTQIIKTIIFK